MERTTACFGWEERLINRLPIIPPPLFPEKAEEALVVFKELRVTDLPGKPTFGECADQWVFDFVAAIFGGCDPNTGNQLIREYGMLISKKNTKSTIAAGIMLTAVILCWREDEEHLIIAPTKEVADNSFKPAAGMVRADRELSALFHVQDHIRTISHRISKASLKVVAAEADSVGGKKSGRILIDELWIFGKRSTAHAMLMEATGGLVSRPEGWAIYLTTQSDEPPAGVFKEKLDYWRGVRDGKIDDPRTLPILYEFPDEMIKSKAYMEPENFYITNPNLGRSVSKSWLSDELRKFSNNRDGSFQQFLAKHLNIEIGMNLRSDRWAGANHWEECEDPQLTLEELLDRSEIITAGVDGGGLDDLLGFAVIGRERETGNWLHWGRAWVHKTALELRKEIAPRLLDFESEGDLVIVDHIGDDVRELADILSMIHQRGLFPEKAAIGMDQIGINFEDEFAAADVPGELLVGVSQGYRLAGTIMTVERKLAQGTFLHGGRPMMSWCVGNCRVEQRSNSILITKQASGKSKIDPVMALLDAAQLMSLNPEASQNIDDFINNPVFG